MGKSFKKLKYFFALFLFPSFAFAALPLSISGKLGFNYGSMLENTGISPWSYFWGGEVAYNYKKLVYFGLFYDRTSISLDGGRSASMQMIGPTLRLRGSSNIVESNLFGEFQLGLAALNEQEYSTRNSIGYSFGASYELPLSDVVSLRGSLHYRRINTVINGLDRIFHFFEPSLLMMVYI